MILAIDIGNTNTVIGGFDGAKLIFTARIITNAAKTWDEYASKLKSVLLLHNADSSKIDGCIISSVVPPLTSVMKKAVNFAYGIDSLVVEPGIKTGINIKCDDPSSVGADIICACVAAHNIYGSPSMVIDMGTATKISVVDKSGAFIGAVIAPGVMIALKALSSGTAQLPQIGLEAPSSAIGKNTVDCMRSGVVFGNASMLDGMIERVNAQIGESLPVYATGGLASAIVPHCKSEITLDENLVLKGLNIIYKKNKC